MQAGMHLDLQGVGQTPLNVLDGIQQLHRALVANGAQEEHASDVEQRRPTGHQPFW